MTSDPKVPFLKSELDGYIDSLRRVTEAIRSGERPMFVGGPNPSSVLETIATELEKRGLDAAASGAIPARGNG